MGALPMSRSKGWGPEQVSSSEEMTFSGVAGKACFCPQEHTSTLLLNGYQTLRTEEPRETHLSMS